MSQSQLPPDTPSEGVLEDYELSEETTIDELISQFYQTSHSTIPQAYTPTTFIATDPLNYATNMHTSGTPPDPFFNSQNSGSESFQAVPWDFESVSNEFASLATASYEALQSSQAYPPYVPWQETMIPEDGMFPIDLPLPPSPVNVPSPGLGVAAQPLPQDEQPMQAESVGGQTRQIGGQTLVFRNVFYDDDEIPRNDSSWLLRPHKHPWVQSSRAYLCPFDSCQITIVQRKNKRRHNAIVHGIMT